MDAGSADLLRIDDFTLDLRAAELRRGEIVVDVEPQVFDLIVFLARNAGRAVSKDEIVEAVWGGRIVSDSAIANRINAARRALGDDGKNQRYIRTLHRRGFRFEVAAEPAGEPQANPPAAARGPTPVDIRYCTAPDGVHLAYATLGQGPPLLKSASYLTHLQHDSEGILWAHWIEALSRDFRFVRYDQRGNGLSDWEVEDISFEAMVTDMETVVDALGLDRFLLLGISQGAAVSIRYAHRNPGRVAGLVIYGGYAAGWANSPDENWRNRRNALAELVRTTWGDMNPAGRQAFASLFLPEGTPEEHAEFNRLQQITATPENAYRIIRSFSTMDVRPDLASLTVPTLVMHCRNDAVVPYQAGREIAAGIPGARFVLLEGNNHVLRETDAAWPRFIRELRAFAGEHFRE